MKILAAFLVTNSLIFSSANSPLILVISAIVQTILICVMLKNLLQTAWFSFILFIIFVGGLMILFVYITSLAANNLFQSSKITVLNLIAVMAVSMALSHNFLLCPKNFSSINTVTSVVKVYTQGNFLMFITLMFYLLLVLLIAVSVVEIKKSPLRSTVY